MKTILFSIFWLLSGILYAQTAADTLFGKWKFAGLYQKKVTETLPYEKFHSDVLPPKFEYVEFKNGDECVYNEETLDDVGSDYSLKAHSLKFAGGTYLVKFADHEHLSLYREMYSCVDASGEKIYVRKEELSFKRIF